jgi:hypothetical protein
LLDGDVVLAVLGEVREVLADLVVEAQLAVLDEQHRGGAGGDRLGERGEVEDGVGRHRLARRFDLARAVRLAVKDLPVAHHQDDGAGGALVVDRGGDGGVDPFGIGLGVQRRGGEKEQ